MSVLMCHTLHLCVYRLYLRIPEQQQPISGWLTGCHGNQRRLSAAIVQRILTTRRREREHAERRFLTFKQTLALRLFTPLALRLFSELTQCKLETQSCPGVQRQPSRATAHVSVLKLDKNGMNESGVGAYNRFSIFIIYYSAPITISSPALKLKS